MYRVGARELKQHTGEIIERVRKGERVVLTLRGDPVAVISPLDADALEEALGEEAKRAEKESLGRLAASESGERAEDGAWQISH